MLATSGRPAIPALRRAPLVLRDAMALGCLFAVCLATDGFPAVQVSAAVPVLAVALAVLALALGVGSAAFAALLLVMVLRWRPEAMPGMMLQALDVLTVSIASLGLAFLLNQLRHRRADAEQANAQMGTTVQVAAQQVEQARRALREAEARLAAEADRSAKPAGIPKPANDPFGSAFRSEGGI